MTAEQPFNIPLTPEEADKLARLLTQEGLSRGLTPEQILVNGIASLVVNSTLGKVSNSSNDDDEL